MTFSYEFTLNIVQFMAVVSRMTGLYMGFPLFRSVALSMRVKTAIILLSSVIVLPGLPPEWSAQAFQVHLSIFSIFSILLVDLLIGLTVGLCVNLLMETTTIAGQFISINVGYSMSKQMDPTSGQQSSTIGFMLTQMMFIIFLTMDLHLVFIRIAADSFQYSAPGQNLLSYDHLNTIVNLGSDIFVYALQMSLPIIAVMFVINLSMGIISRFGQDFQVLMISFPLRLGVGLTLLIILMPSFIVVFTNIYAEIFDNLGRILNF